MDVARKILCRFWADNSGELALDFIAVTASAALLMATYVHTNQESEMPREIEISEEVFVRKCGKVQVVQRGLPDRSQTSLAPCG